MVILDQPAYLDCGLQLCYEWFVRDNLKERNFLSLLLPVHIRKVSSIALPLSLFFCSTFSIYFLKDFIDLSERERESRCWGRSQGRGTSDAAPSREPESGLHLMTQIMTWNETKTWFSIFSIFQVLSFLSVFTIYHFRTWPSAAIHLCPGIFLQHGFHYETLL